MVEEVHQHLQTFVAGQFLVKIAIRFLRLGETTKFLGPSFHDLSIDLAARYSERI